MDRCKAHTHLGFLLNLSAWGYGNLVPVAPGRELWGIFCSVITLRPLGPGPAPTSGTQHPAHGQSHGSHALSTALTSLTLPSPLDTQANRLLLRMLTAAPHTHTLRSFSLTYPQMSPCCLSQSYSPQQTCTTSSTYTQSLHGKCLTFSHTDPHTSSTHRLSFTYSLVFSHRPPHAHVRALLHILPHLLSPRLIHKCNTHTLPHIHPHCFLTCVHAHTHTESLPHTITSSVSHKHSLCQECSSAKSSPDRICHCSPLCPWPSWPWSLLFHL